jgi:uncharacterized protein YutE (UPF0331/DUF86 family)
MPRDRGDSRDAAQSRIPLPIAQRLRTIVPAYRALQLLLGEVSFEEYQAGLHGQDPVALKDVVFPLERAYELNSNLLVELTGLGLAELGLPSIDGPRDLAAFARAGVISARLADQLVMIHRARNELTHDYPDLRASVLYPACQELVKLLPAFLRSYTRWLRTLGYAAPTA